MLRADFIKQRQQLSDTEKQQAAERICQQLIALPEFQQAQHIGLYHAFNGEVPTDAIEQIVQQHNKHCYLPVIIDFENHIMAFYAVDEKTIWKKNKFGIDEPDIDHLQPVSGEVLDLVVAPLVAFNAECYRLGMGAGFYDRWMAAQRELPFCVGIAYDFQFCKDMAVERWDQPLHKVITPSGMHARDVGDYLENKT
ncbi:MAG: 5-formyltetrahydrofolate cyclo-ligase [Coxiellaceae bacterium]|nr:5-formyltetrahydrofolate cyclo-ligase [Coxiellaceae bacterium]